MPFKTSQPPHQPFESIFGLNSFSHNEEIIGYFSSEKREANALTLCTEYLGFESCDIKMSDKEVETTMTCHVEDETERLERKRRKTEEENVVGQEKVGKREFPPLISSLNSRGKRSFCLRSVRHGGRLKLTKVMINQPEIFNVSRENGRLRLHFIDGITRKEDICESLAKEVEEIEDEPKGLDRLHLQSGKHINGENNNISDQVVDISMINDDSDARCCRYESSHKVLLNDGDDVAHDEKEWRYKSCYKIVANLNNDDNDDHHHIHPYHHYNGNNNMHLWSRSYVKTR